MVATIISLSVGAVGFFHKELSTLEVALLFIPIGISLFQQRCRYQGLKSYAHAQFAATQLTAIAGIIKNDGETPQDAHIKEEKDKLVECLDRNAESEKWFKRADLLCDWALGALFGVAIWFFVVRMVPAISCGTH